MAARFRAICRPIPDVGPETSAITWALQSMRHSSRVGAKTWMLVYADGKANEFEDNVIWRAADLLHVASRDRIEMRRRVSGQDA